LTPSTGGPLQRRDCASKQTFTMMWPMNSLQKKRSKLSVESLITHNKFSAKFAGIMNKLPRIHCCAAASAMAVFAIYITNVLRTGSSRK